MLNQLKGVFRSFHSNDERYLVLGGVAAILYGVPRATLDLNILIDPTHDNAARLLAALSEVGFGTASLTSPEDLVRHEITIFRDVVRIDVQTSTPGLEFSDAWQRRETMHYEGQEFCVVSRQDLIASKRACGREVDLSDVRVLEAFPDAGGRKQEP